MRSADELKQIFQAGWNDPARIKKLRPPHY